ncbi:tRNA (adenosine(37)-N6)-dimethylallyltransferase MiaA [Persicimonas caeni]|uniref:tRNA dimethylallyltransferase n=1 Tax=Persicimonas caeni TaxID=2292766 RepID=A0A4Y6Q211_PERCE|nr:tRNA (adenosine(37)-N6)-dimethylallyltransferase MiaA [Persicimonas caeni]QDG54035.1 tRNA (adenosine(37)-N6)-dimethylallyltransferase MiaA [Persicimonas caeni]QED35256.1 tRNA (adenosine(37)-N6)-dimethylallyltransferase MiaA [Persicimonas caeni]
MDIADISTSGLPKILVIAGPTAVGKTSLALEVAERLDGEIVNYDSVQLYRMLDIGTAKPSEAERARVPHHLFDVLDPDEESNVADYIAMAEEAIADIVRRGKIPILVGGTGMYVRILVHGIFEAPPPDEEIRARHRALAEEKGRPFLHAKLAEVDPDLAERIHPNDLVRVSRGLEIYEQTGKPLSVHQREHRFQKPNYDALKIALLRPRDELYERINRRAELMLERGLVEEYEAVIAAGYDRQLKPLQSLGYRQMGEHIFDDVPLDEAVEDIKGQTRRYAKQQISWFRNEPHIHWALAPLERDGELPAQVLGDIETFFEGGEPDLEWAQLDPYDVSRPD